MNARGHLQYFGCNEGLICPSETFPTQLHEYKAVLLTPGRVELLNAVYATYSTCNYQPLLSHSYM